MRDEHLGHLAVTPEQRHDQRRPAIAACEDIGARAGLDQQRGEPRLVAIRRLVQGRPAVHVRGAWVGAARQQQLREAEIPGRAGHPEQIIAVGPPFVDKPGCLVEHARQGVGIAGLDRPVGAHERLAGFGQPGDVLAQLRPRAKAVLGCDHRPRSVLGQRRPMLRERARRGLGPVPGGLEQADGATLVILEVLVVGMQWRGHRSLASVPGPW